MKYTFEDITTMITGEAMVANPGQPVTELVVDSRKIYFPESAVFIALRGYNHDGHHYIDEAKSKGIRNFIMEDRSYVDESGNFLIVKDSLTALQELTREHRKRFDMPIIGITGSNGKTVVKEWLFNMLEDDYRIIRSPKSYNSQTGVPLSVWKMEDSHELGIFEAGISKSGEMERLANIIKPSIGIFTNIGAAHAAGFISMEEKIREKLRLFTDCEAVIFCKDHQSIDSNIQATIPPDNQISWGKSKTATVQIIKERKMEQSVELLVQYQHKEYNIAMPFTDLASVENAMHVVAVMLHFGYTQNIINRRLQRLQNLPLRLELKHAVNDCLLIYDCYNSDLTSLKIALDFLDHQKQYDHKTVILSDIHQAGMNEDLLYEEVLGILLSRPIHRFIGVGEAIQRLKDKLKHISNTHFFLTTSELADNLPLLKLNQEVILLKGARNFAFEKIGQKLETKAHETVLEINLNALANNLRVYNNLLNTGVKLMVMVKAFAYGSGSSEVANLLQFHHIDYLAVAYTDEGVELRNAGITLPIMVMNPEVNNIALLLQYGLEPEVYSFRIWRKVLKAARDKETGGPVPVHLKLDTGMHRLGFLDDEVPALVKEIKENASRVTVKSIFSHLASSDCDAHDPFTHSQFERFESMCEKVESGLGYKPLRHILNSAAIAKFPDNQYDMVRLGIGLYGVDPSQKIQSQLEQISTLRTVVSQIKKVKAGDTVGYGRRGKAETAKTIATIGIGYADGVNRKLGNGKGKMWVKGQLAPTIGSICMDMCMLDITGIEGVEEGDEVIVFGKQLPIQQVAEWEDTIPYEILTNISERVKRVYFEE